MNVSELLFEHSYCFVSGLDFLIDWIYNLFIKFSLFQNILIHIYFFIYIQNTKYCQTGDSFWHPYTNMYLTSLSQQQQKRAS